MAGLEGPVNGLTRRGFLATVLAAVPAMAMVRLSVPSALSPAVPRLAALVKPKIGPVSLIEPIDGLALHPAKAGERVQVFDWLTSAPVLHVAGSDMVCGDWLQVGPDGRVSTMTGGRR